MVDPGCGSATDGFLRCFAPGIEDNAEVVDAGGDMAAFEVFEERIFWSGGGGRVVVEFDVGFFFGFWGEAAGGGWSVHFFFICDGS